MGLSKLIETINFFIKEGVEITKIDEDQQKLRISLCNNCENFNKGLRICNICKCNMDVKTALLYDPVEELKNGEKNVLTKCPKGLW